MQLIEEKKDSNRFKIYIALREMEGRIKMKLNKRNSKGITLIALIVTIIGILILASVSINILFGENGIIEKTKRARGEYNNSQIAEQQDLEEVEKQLAEYENTLPENTAQNPQNAGTQVKMPSSWYTTIPAYISTEDGKTIKRSVKVASVVAVATGNGETVPVPNDFYYVGGTISSGVVISDNKEDQNKYVDEENGDVPAGVVYNEDGTINKESSDLKGNQFVWIPVEANNYKENYDSSNPSDFKQEYDKNYAYTKKITQDQWDKLIQYHNDHNTYDLLWNNCVLVATRAWNLIYQDDQIDTNAIPSVVKNRIKEKSNSFVYDLYSVLEYSL